jgi:hypothetical protein
MAEWLAVLKAREAGYSDGEILDRLGEKEGIADRIAQARDRGYGDDQILERMAKKIGGVEAFGLGAADGVTFNTTDELVGIGAYNKSMKDQGHEVRYAPLADAAIGKVAKPIETAVSPISALFGLPFGGKKEKPTQRVATGAEIEAAYKRDPKTYAALYERYRKNPEAYPTKVEGPVTKEAASRKATAYASEEREGVRHAQDRARAEDGGAYFGGTVAGSLVPVGSAFKATGAVKAIPGAQKITRAMDGARKTVGDVAIKAVPQQVRTAAANAKKILPPAARSALGDVASTVGRGASVGAGYGALSGFGDARGGMDERISGAMSGAGQGAMFGSVLAPVARYGVGGASAFLREKFGRSDADKAKTMIVRRMRADGVDIDKLHDDFYAKAKSAEAVDQADEIDRWLEQFATPGKRDAKEPKLRRRIASDTVDETLGELTGQGTKDLQIALATRPGPGKAKAAETFLKRGQETGRRINRSFSDALKAEGDEFYDEAARLKEKRLKDPEEPYKAAHALKVEDEESYHIWKMFGERKRFKDVLPKAAQYAEDFGRPKVKAEILRYMDDLAEGKDWRKTKHLSVEALDYVERMLSDGLDYLAGKSPAQAAGVRQARDALRKLLPKELNDARDISARGYDAERALQEGRQAFQQGVDFEEIVSRLQDSQPEARDAYIKGVARGIYDMFARQRDLGGLADAANRVAGNDLQRQKLMELMPKTASGKPSAAAKALLERLDREARMTGQAKAALGNSQTAARQAALEAAEEGDVLDNIAGLIAERLSGQGGKATDRAGAWFVDRVKRPGIANEGINRELSDRLFATGRDPVVAALKELKDHNARLAPKMLSDTPEKVVTRVAGRKTGQEAAAADPMAQDAPATRADMVVEGLERPLIAEYLNPETPPERLAEIEAMFGQDAANLRALRAERGE